MSSTRLVTNRKFPGATISDMYHYLISLLEKKPDHVILHFGVNDAVNYEGTKTVDKLLQLNFIPQKLPWSNVILLEPIMRVDTKQREHHTTDFCFLFFNYY